MSQVSESRRRMTYWKSSVSRSPVIAFAIIIIIGVGGRFLTFHNAAQVHTLLPYKRGRWVLRRQWSCRSIWGFDWIRHWMFGRRSKTDAGPFVVDSCLHGRVVCARVTALAVTFVAIDITGHTGDVIQSYVYRYVRRTTKRHQRENNDIKKGGAQINIGCVQQCYVILNGDSWRERVSDAMKLFHWLPVVYRIRFKLCRVMYAVVGGQSLEYIVDVTAQISESIRPRRLVFRHSQALWHSSDLVPSTGICFGDRTFAVAGPRE